MSIVRELVTRLAFQIDQSGINKFNSTISGFKRGLEGIASGAFSIGQSVFEFFQKSAAESFVIKDIATQAGIAVDRFAALRQAAGQFNIKPEQFDQAFIRLNDLVQQATFRTGALFDISQQLGIEIRGLDGNLLTTEEIFNNIVAVLGRTEDAMVRQRIAVHLFGQEVGPRLADYSLQGADALGKAAEKLKGFGEDVNENVAALSEFDKSVNSINTSVARLGQIAVKNLAPAVNAIVAVTGKALERVKPNFFLVEGHRVSEQEYNDYEEQRKEFALRNQEAAARNVSGIASNKSNSLSVNQSNNITIEVPPGTNEEQASVMNEKLKLTMQAQNDEVIREIINNNPQVE